MTWATGVLSSESLERDEAAKDSSLASGTLSCCEARAWEAFDCMSWQNWRESCERILPLGLVGLLGSLSFGLMAAG